MQILVLARKGSYRFDWNLVTVQYCTCEIAVGAEASSSIDIDIFDNDNVFGNHSQVPPNTAAATCLPTSAAPRANLSERVSGGNCTRWLRARRAGRWLRLPACLHAYRPAVCRPGVPGREWTRAARVVEQASK